MFFPYLVGLSVVLMTSTQKPVNSGSDGISDEWNILEASVGTEELAHLEMVSAIVYQLTKGLSADEIRRQGFDTYFVDHTAGVWPQAAGGTPFTSMCFASKGDAITDLHEDMAADGATGKEQQCCLSGSVRFSCALARAAKI